MSRIERSHWHRTRTARASLVAVSLSALMLASCSSNEPAPQTATETVTPTPTVDKSAVPEPELPTVWPLTGVAAESIEERPAIAVKIENTAAARPQYGLDKADVVWETIVEFDVSRFIAVYHSEYPTEVGPVRSVRPMDYRVISPLKGMFVYSGGQAGILRELRADKNIQALDETSGQSAMWRFSGRRAPHNLHADLAKFELLADSSHDKTPAEQFAFAETYDAASAVTDGSAATSLHLNMSSAAKPSWQWDSSKKVWLRSEGTSPAVVASGDRISATNVVIITAKHFDSGFDAQNNAPVPDYELTGTGEALVATGGKTIKATWSKKDNASPLTLSDDEGDSVTLAPGQTWVELLPAGSGSYTTE